jgi:uncharacterized YccA/Bax inhibitor family protein
VANPVLNEKSLRKAAESDAGWAAPEAESRRPIDDGPVGPWTPTTGSMTIGGTVSATAVLFVLLLAAAVVGWFGVKAPEGEVYSFPGFAIAGVLVGLVCALALAFRPQWARVLGPVYAIAEGLFIGAVSRAYETYYDGIVVQAAGATIAVFAVMLGLHTFRILKVTDRMRRIVVGATLGIAVFYGISLLLSLFGASPSFISSSSPFGILFSFLVAGLAAFNLSLDFDFIERGVEQRLPRSVEWFAAFGVLVTVVWLYLEILRLLAKLRDR